MKEKRKWEKKRKKVKVRKNIDRWGNSIVALRTEWMKVKVIKTIKKERQSYKKEVKKEGGKVKTKILTVWVILSLFSRQGSK